MTTSIISPTVSCDLIITTPAQLAKAFALWNARYIESFGWSADIADNMDGTAQANHLTDLLAELNGQGE